MILGGPDSKWGWGNFEEGEGAAHCKVNGHFAVACAKTAATTVLPFELWDRAHPRNHELNGDPDSP